MTESSERVKQVEQATGISKADLQRAGIHCTPTAADTGTDGWVVQLANHSEKLTMFDVVPSGRHHSIIIRRAEDWDPA